MFFECTTVRFTTVQNYCPLGMFAYIEDKERSGRGLLLDKFSCIHLEGLTNEKYD
jgi:hypothetical protein